MFKTVYSINGLKEAIANNARHIKVISRDKNKPLVLQTFDPSTTMTRRALCLSNVNIEFHNVIINSDYFNYDENVHISLYGNSQLFIYTDLYNTKFKGTISAFDQSYISHCNKGEVIDFIVTLEDSSSLQTDYIYKTNQPSIILNGNRSFVRAKGNTIIVTTPKSISQDSNNIVELHNQCRIIMDTKIRSSTSTLRSYTNKILMYDRSVIEISPHNTNYSFEVLMFNRSRIRCKLNYSYIKRIGLWQNIKRFLRI